MVEKKLEAKYQSKQSWLRNKIKPRADSFICKENLNDARFLKTNKVFREKSQLVDQPTDPALKVKKPKVKKARRFIKRKV